VSKLQLRFLLINNKGLYCYFTKIYFNKILKCHVVQIVARLRDGQYRFGEMTNPWIVDCFIKPLSFHPSN
jgi:hypothetical protein